MPFLPRERFLWHLRTRTLALGDRTVLMAIVNVTPDSFSGDGKTDPKPPIADAIRAHDNGADILDIGAESTRPKATPLSPEAELRRLLPVLEGVRKQRPDALISVDTYHSATARAAADLGVEIINDVSGLLWDPAMSAAVADGGCGLVLMHTRGRPGDWQTQPALPPEEVAPTVLAGLRQQMAVATAAGIPSERVLLDPGFGFGKVGQENFSLLARFDALKSLGRPLLAGLSRKGFLGEAVRPLQPETLHLAHARRTATIAANTAAILSGAHILRVHELQPAREAAAIADAILNASAT